jgi:hypothetical protein
MNKTLLPLTLLAVLLLAACGATRISRINADPTRYQNKNVKVTGTVVNSFGILGKGAYQIQDDTGRIYVISGTGVPSKGTRVTVEGRVMPGATIMGRSLGTAIQEQRHKVKY